MGCGPVDVACLARRLATKLEATEIVIAGEVDSGLVAALREAAPVPVRPAAGPTTGLLVADAASDAADLGEIARSSAATLLVAHGRASPPELDRWAAAGFRPAWRGRTARPPSAVAVLHREDDDRAARLLAGGPHGLLLDTALDVLDAPADLAGVRVVIVTYELVGLTRTGGIGTAYTALAHALARAGAHVDALFTGWPSPGIDLTAAVATYAESDVHVHLLDLDQADAVRSPSEHARRGEAALRWLLKRHAATPYDVIHLPECAGHGAAIAAAKRAGEAFAHATVVAGTHGSSRWVKEINGEPVSAPDHLTIEALERRSVEDADVVVSPSAYLVGDMCDRGWRMPERTFVQQYVLPPAAQEAAPARQGPLRELVFFGRLEARKGILLFFDALDRLADRIPADELTVTFLGRPDLVAGRRADELVAERRAAWPWRVQLLTGLDQPDALAHLRGPQRLAVMPSLADNLPLTVLEGLALGIPFVTCATGGIPEMIDAADLERCASEPEPDALADLLERALAHDPLVPRFAVEVQANLEAHLRWHAAIARAETIAAPAAQADPADVPSVVELGAPDGLPTDPEAFVLLRSRAHALDDDAPTRLQAAAWRAGADAVTFSTRGADGRVAVPIGGPASLAPVASVMSTGSALVRRALLDRVPADERELETVLAGAVLAGRHLLVLPAALAEERQPGDGVTPGAGQDAVLSWWPAADELARADAVRLRLEGGLGRELRDLPVVATLVGERLTATLARLEEVEEVAQRMTAHWKEARDTLERRDRELAETVVWARNLQDDLVVTEKRLRALRSRRSVRAALAVASLKQRLLRR